MAKYDYSKRLDNLKKRRRDDDLEKSASQYEILTESYEKINDTSTVKYVIGAMQPVSAKYTQNTYAEAKRVQNHLQDLNKKGYRFEFKYQGSVTNNTHIKAHSDIDILTLHLGFVTLEPPQKAASPYKGDPVKDLCRMREDSFSILRNAFPEAEIDNEGAKSISLKGGSLRRKVDVVPSNWYDTVKYTQTNIDYYRGVMVLDYKAKKRIENTPFYHNKLLADKDGLAGMNYKKVVRLLKTLKADSEAKINLSSYDIAALMYHMNDSDYLVGKSPLRLIQKTLGYMKYVYENQDHRNSLWVPDKSRRIFESGKASAEDLKLLIQELNDTYQNLLEDLKLSGSSIEKEIVA
jgi:hypothetical protein